ncbi:MAG: RodZ domain-containing protein, partial [Sulfuricella sp.]
EFGGKGRLMPFGDHSGKPWTKYAAIIGVAVLVLSWGMHEFFQGQPSSQDALVKSAGETTMVLSLPQAEAPVQTAPVTNRSAEPATATATVPAAAPVAPATAQAPVPSAPPLADVGGQRLQFAFDGDAWVEVKDRSGKVVFYQLNPKGSQQSVRGNPPFSLVIGNAAHVRLTYNDKPVDLAPHVKVDVARLTIE